MAQRDGSALDGFRAVFLVPGPLQHLILFLPAGRWCPTLVSSGCDKHHDRKLLGKERIHLAYASGHSPSPREVLAGTETENYGEMRLTGSPTLT